MTWLRLHDDLVPFSPDRILDLRCISTECYTPSNTHKHHIFCVPMGKGDLKTRLYYENPLERLCHLVRPSTPPSFKAGKSKNKTMRIFPLRNKSALWNCCGLWKKKKMGQQRNRAPLTCCSFVMIILSNITENHDINPIIIKILLKFLLNWNLFWWKTNY